MFTFYSFSISKLNNAEYLAFIINFQKAIKQATAASLGLEDSLMTSYATLQQSITDQVYNALGSEQTLAMQNADDKRDKIFRRIMLRLQMVLYAEENAELNNVKDAVESIILSKYTIKVTSMPMQEETGVLSGFIYDLEQRLDGEVLSTLGISDDLDNLKSANEEFISAYNLRSQQRAAGDTGLTSRLRTQMNELYQRICLIVQYNANDTLEANATKAAACQSFIGVANVLLSDAKKRYNTRLGKTSDEATDSTDSTDSTDENGSESTDENSNDAADTSATDTSGTSTSGSGSSTADTSGTSTSGSTSGSSSGNSTSGGDDDDDDDVVHL